MSQELFDSGAEIFLSVLFNPCPCYTDSIQVLLVQIIKRAWHFGKELIIREKKWLQKKIKSEIKKKRS